MAKVPSQREQDQNRRSTGTGAASRGKFIVGVLLAVAIVAVLLWAAQPAPAAVTRDANFVAFGLADDPFLGDPEAPVVLVGYESPHCSACQHFHRSVLPELQAQIDAGSVVYYYIQGTIGDDMASSVAQECALAAGGNDAFWDITDRLYGRSYTYTAPDWPSWLADLAAMHNLDGDDLQECFDEGRTSQAVREDLRVGRDQGAAGTPTFWAFTETGSALAIKGFTQVPAITAELAAQAA